MHPQKQQSSPDIEVSGTVAKTLPDEYAWQCIHFAGAAQKQGRMTGVISAHRLLCGVAGKRRPRVRRNWQQPIQILENNPRRRF
jgi:hypothetical protein